MAIMAKQLYWHRAIVEHKIARSLKECSNCHSKVLEHSNMLNSDTFVLNVCAVTGGERSVGMVKVGGGMGDVS